MPTVNPEHVRRILLPVVVLGLLVVVAAAQFGLIAELSTHDLNVAIPHLLGRGMHFYTDVTSFHPPLISVLLAAAYGISPTPLLNIRVLNVVLVLGTGFLLFWTGRRLWGTAQGVWALVFYSIWSVNYNSIFFYLDALIGFVGLLLLLLSTFHQRLYNLLLLGGCAGVAMLLKQNGAGMLVAAAVGVLFMPGQARMQAIRRAAIVIIAGLAVYVAQFGILALAGVLEPALFFMFNPGNSNWLGELRGLLDGNALRTISVTGIFVPAFALLWLRAPDRRPGVLIWLVLAAGLLLNIPVPGYYHFMAPLPIIAAMSGYVLGTMFEGWHTAVEFGRTFWQRAARIPASHLLLGGLAGGILLAMLVTAFTPLFVVFSGRVQVLGWDELQPVSDWLQANTTPDELVLVLPTYDTNGNVYAQADRLPPFYMKTWSYHARVPQNIALLETRIQQTPPAVIVLFPQLFDEIAEYFENLPGFIAQHYSQVGQIEALPFHGAVVFLRHDDSHFAFETRQP